MYFFGMDMEEHPFRFEVTARYADSFSGRAVRAPALMEALEEAAVEHCRAIGRDIFSLLDDGQGWILTGGGLRMIEYPSYGDRFVVETWISEWKEFSGIREYRISAPDGRTLGEGGGRWVFWDMTTRRPRPVPNVFRERWHFRVDSPYRRMYPASATPAIPGNGGVGAVGGEPRRCPDGGADPGFESVERVELKVRRGDVDLYDHLHNTTYMDWLMEAVPDGIYERSEPARLGIRFFGEARLGDEVAFLTRKNREGLLHDVVRESDGTLLVRGFSEWRERDRAVSA